ncbi:MAG TPA: response regulator transcription factor [Terriglobales bacterium]|nr:response regulator transcription factor [Terriglobales bacterium]
MAKILVVDDDGHIREVVRFALERAGHQPIEAADGSAALIAFDRDHPDLVVLDIVMPEMDGIDVCRKLREKSEVPILFLSSRDDELDRVLGLEIGADDYVIKPFSPRELMARIKALLRRSGRRSDNDEEEPILERGPLRLDPNRHRCYLDGGEVVLTASEFELVKALMGSAGKVYSRGELVERAWGFDHHITERTIDSHIRRVRRKFADHGGDPIETVYGIGYRLRS